MRRLMVVAALLFQTSPPPCVPSAVVNVQSAINAALGISCALTPTPQVDVFTSGAPFVLSRVPIGNPALPAPMIYLNGVLQAVSVDYQIAGQILAFTATDLGTAPTVQVIYWYAQ